MKFFIVFSILAFSACANATFLKNHPFLGGKKSESVPAPIEPIAPAPAPIPLETSAPVSGGGHGGLGGLAGIGKLLLIPINIKKSLLQSHQKRFNKHFDHIIGTFSKFGGSLGGGSTVENDIVAPGISSGPAFVPEPAPQYVSQPAPQFISEPAPSAGGLSGGFGGNVDYNALGGGEVSGGSASTTYQGGNSFDSGSAYSGSNSYSAGSPSGNFGNGGVHTYHPQPAPNTQYSSNPIVLHLYGVESGAQAHSNVAHDCNTAHQQPIPIPQPVQISQPAPIAQQIEISQPVQSYENDFVSSGSISETSNVQFEPQVMQEITPIKTYLPPFKK